MNPDLYASQFLADLDSADRGSERSQQAEARVLGFSDIGQCSEYLRRFLNGDEFTDEPDLTSARIGNWVDAGVKKVRAEANPHLLTDLEVTCTLPSGIQLTGHPDEVDPRVPLVVDLKTVDRLAAVKRTGPSEAQRIQRSLQYLACLQSGVFTSDQGWVGNIWLDRSGTDAGVHVDLEPWSEAEKWVEIADARLLAVLRANELGIEADKEKYEPFCRRYCRMYSACRGSDLTSGEHIDGATADLISLYAEADGKEKQGKALKEALRVDLLGLNGTTDTHAIRTSRDNKLVVSLRSTA